MQSRNEDACLPSNNDRSARIRQLNDALRTGNGEGQLLVTPGVLNLANGTLPVVIALLHGFDDFSDDNDPHGEHDFGAFNYRGEKLFWKINYYDRSLRFGSDDPANPAITTRVLTLLLAREY
ncbi:DUF3768 domain-containing protein [Aurantiacibacter luteus]|uniref:DUF3768 domain-containing protein n=1 Tax=Aurantiacibacter luteus TaxID=1581420 RepID=A0A0G9MP80_9SPHN|nr:DUF3768 domain-containing protein [Aurantiacibacter luteus]KLE32399.1 hypothetical protein AAW00_13250 [Aurantiacibacter luteus]